MRYLIVAAHPDDEVLGAGATIHKLAKQGHEIYVCMMSHWSPTRDDNLEDGIRESHRILGVKKAYIGDFGCMRFKDADHHEIVRFIESCIKDCLPEVLITHHPADIHVDHGITAECCLESAKLPQRGIIDIPKIRNISFMEVPSSTDWNINTSNGTFVANSFEEVTEQDIEAKIRAIEVYKDVMRSRPHPRSREALFAKALCHGCESGYEYAEAFQTVFRLGV